MLHDLFFVPGKCCAQALTWRGWIEHGLSKKEAVLHTQSDDLMFADDFLGAALRAVDEKVRETPAFQFSSPLEHSLLFRADARLQPLALQRRCLFVCASCHPCPLSTYFPMIRQSSLPTYPICNVRMISVHVK